MKCGGKKGKKKERVRARCFFLIFITSLQNLRDKQWHDIISTIGAIIYVSLFVGWGTGRYAFTVKEKEKEICGVKYLVHL